MTELKITVPTVGEKNAVADPQTQSAFEEIRSFLNGAQLDAVNIKKEGVTEGLLSAAVQTLLSAKVAGFTVKSYVASSAVANGELACFFTEGTVTATLPPPSGGATVAVYNVGPGVVKVKTSSGIIFGDFVNPGKAAITLLSGQHVTLTQEGTGYLIMAGEPKRESVYVETKPSENAWKEEGIVPSATRPALVTVEAVSKNTNEGLYVFVYLGGVHLFSPRAGASAASTSTAAATFQTNGGEAWKLLAFSGAIGTVNVYTKLL